MSRTILTTLSLITLFTACNDGTDETGNGNGNGDGVCLQDDAITSGQVNIIEESVTVTDKLAITYTAAAPTVSLPAGFENAAYYGAVDPDATTAWWEGWTYIDPAVDGGLPGAAFHPLQDEIESGTISGAPANACTSLSSDYDDGGTVTLFGETFPVCVVTQPILDDVTWPNNHVFVLSTSVEIGTGDAKLEGGTPPTNATLTISPGTQVFAVEDSATALIATRGSKLIAEGTADEPILFAAVAADLSATNVITGDATDLTGRGDWGGVVLSGFGQTNSGDSNNELLTEASPQEEERWYGGDDNSDDSGSIEYAIIAESGFEFRPDQEVQGLTLEAAGSGTNIDYVQIIGSEDDCIEWFGGAAPARHLLCLGSDDDGLDQDLGYVGNIQFAIVRIGESNGDHGIESDSNGDNFEAAPQTAPNMANITILGNAGKDGNSTDGALHREGWRGKVFRSVYTDDTLAGGAFENGCLDVDDVLPAALAYEDVIFNCTPGPLAQCDDE